MEIPLQVGTAEYLRSNNSWILCIHYPMQMYYYMGYNKDLLAFLLLFLEH
jgi:hypothetical protein